jgi:two-component system chemotaxis response regulator CheY
MKALIADDSKTVRALLSEMLEESGFDVSEAADGLEALTYLRAHPDTDLLLTDWNMPNLTGFELLTEVRADALLSGIRVVMVTMESDYASVRNAFRAGVDDFLLKPCTKESVRKKLSALGFEM